MTFQVQLKYGGSPTFQDDIYAEPARTSTAGSMSLRAEAPPARRKTQLLVSAETILKAVEKATAWCSEHSNNTTTYEIYSITEYADSSLDFVA